MQRNFYFLIVGAISLMWLGQRIWAAFKQLHTPPPGGKPLDMRFGGYALEETRHYLALLGEGGRKLYLRTQFRLEMPFIVGYCISGAAAGAWLGAGLVRGGWTYGAWLPIAGGILVALGAVIDLDEAQAIRKLIKNFPRFDDRMVRRASRATRLKFALLIAGALLLLAGGVLAMVALLRG